MKKNYLLSKKKIVQAKSVGAMLKKRVGQK